MYVSFADDDSVLFECFGSEVYLASHTHCNSIVGNKTMNCWYWETTTLTIQELTKCDNMILGNDPEFQWPRVCVYPWPMWNLWPMSRARTIALADQISYECAVERIYFSSTVLFQSRLYRFAAAWREIFARGAIFFCQNSGSSSPKH